MCMHQTWERKFVMDKRSKSYMLDHARQIELSDVVYAKNYGPGIYEVVALRDEATRQVTCFLAT